MKKCIIALTALASLATAPAQQADYFAKVEIRGINQLLTQAGAVAQMIGQEMTPDMLKAMMGGVFSTPNLDGIDLDGTVHLFVPEIDLDADEPPPVVAAIPLAGDGLMTQLKLSMDEKAGEQPGEMMFMPKAGGGPQLGGMPSLASMPFAAKTVGKHVLISMTMEANRQAAANFDTLSEQIKIPGLVAVELDVEPTTKLMEKAMEAQAEQAKMMQKMMIENQRDVVKQLKEAGEDTTDIEESIKQMEELGAETDTAKEVLAGVDGLMQQVDALRFSLDAKNRFFTMYTMVDPKPGTTMADTISKMVPPGDDYLKAMPADSIMSYIGNWPNAEAFFDGYMGLLGNMMTQQPDGDKMMQMLEGSIDMMKGQMKGDVAMAWLPGTKEQPMNMIGMTRINDPAKLVADTEAFYEKMGKMDFGEEAGNMQMEMIPSGQRSYKGMNIKEYKTKVEAKLAGPGPNPADILKNSSPQVAHNDNSVLYAYSPEMMNKLIDNLQSSGGSAYHQSGAFAKNWPTLKQTPTAMYTVDLLGYVHFAMAMAMPDQAAKIPKTGGVLTGWSNKVGNSFIHVDRISYEDVNLTIQAGMTAWQGFMRQIEQGFELEGDGF